MRYSFQGAGAPCPQKLPVPRSSQGDMAARFFCLIPGLASPSGYCHGFTDILCKFECVIKNKNIIQWLQLVSTIDRNKHCNPQININMSKPLFKEMSYS